MLGVIWWIIKIVGIILLAIVVLLLFLLYAVLFVAASYRIRIEKQDALSVEASAGWLFRIVTVRFSLNSAKEWEKRLQVRLFGIPIFRVPEEKRKKKRRRWRRKARGKAPKEEKTEALIEESKEANEGIVTESIETEKEEWHEPSEVSETEDMEWVGEKVENKTDKWVEEALEEEDAKTWDKPVKKASKKIGEKQNKRSGFAEKIKKIDQGIRRKIRQIQKKIAGMKGRYQKLLKRKEELLEFWQHPKHVQARASVLKEIRYLWKKLRPKKIKGQVIFGWEDPAVTGLCMGAVGILMAWYPGQIDVVPDFEHEILKADVWIKGKVRFYVMAAVLWRIYFNKDIRHMYQSWQQL